MRLLLDEDSSDPLLAKLLRAAAHDVETVAALNKRGDPDPKVVIYAIQQQRAVLTRNADDFELLHHLILASGGHHPGVLVTRYDNDAARDLTARGIVIALGKLVTSGSDIPDHLYVLNHWR